MKSILRTRISTNLSAAGAVIVALLSACSGAEGSEPSFDASEADEDGAADVSADRAEPSSTLDAAKQLTQKTDAATQQTEADGSHSRGPATSTRPGDTDADETPSATSSVEDADGEPDATAPTGEPTAPTAEPEASVPPSEPVRTNTLRVVGNRLLDTCGQPFVIRGVEQILGEQLPVGNDWLGIVREIASTGANAVRVLPGVNTLSTDDVDEILTFIGEQGMVAFIDPLNSGGNWYARDDVRAMLKKHESYLIIDAYGEPQYDDIEKWRAEAKEALVRMRALGYTVPFTVYANQYGRGLPSLFDHGAEILAADPLHNTFLGWQAYWGQGGYYQQHYGYSLTEAVQAIVDSGLPIQMGLDYVTDSPSETADYGTLMAGAEANGIGWLWWDFYNPYGTDNNLSADGTANSLTSTGRNVLESHAAGIAKTSKLACAR